MAKTMVETITMQEPTGKSKNKETISPETVAAIPIIGEAIIIFRMFSENWRAVEAGLKRRA